MTFILGLFKGAWKYVAVALGAIAGVVAIYARGRSAGKETERAKQTEKVLENVEKAEKVRRTRDPADRDRVRKFDRRQ